MSIALDTQTTDTTRRDRWGRYVVVPPGGGRPVGYQRATTLAKMLEDTSNLMDWACRMTLLGAAQRPDILSAAMVADPDDRKALNAIVERAKEAGGATVRRDLGAALHKMVEKAHADPSYVAPEQYRADVEAVNAAIAAAGYEVVTEFSEKILVLDRYGVAGMCDLVLRNVATGELVVADLKTGASVNYGALGWSIQLSVYAHADNIYVQGAAKDGSEDQRLPAPAVDRTMGLILHAQPGSGRCDVHALELSEARLELAVAVRDERKRKGLLVPFTIEAGGAGTATRDATSPSTSTTVEVEPHPPVAPSGEAVVDQPAAEVSPSSTSAAGEPVHVATALDAVLHQARVAWALRRIDVILAHATAPTTMGQLWPRDVPRPKEVPGGPGNWTAAQLDEVVRVLDLVEATHEIPFGDEDPKAAAERAAESERRAALDAERMAEATDHAKDEDVAWLRQVLAHMEVDAQAQVLRWIGEADAAGVPWKMSPAGQRTPRRRYLIAAAALELAMLVGNPVGDDTGPRHALALVLGDDAAQHPVGALLGTLTIAQAEQLAALAVSHRLAVDDSGTMRLEAVA